MSAFDDMQAVWQSTSDTPPHLGPTQRADLFEEAERFDRTIRWRDRREYAGVAGIAFVAVWIGVGASPVKQLGAALMVVGAIVAVARLWQAQRRVPPPAPDLPAVDALRQSLARVEIQIDLLRSVLWWYLLPISIGPLLIVATGIVRRVHSLPDDASLWATAGAIGVGLVALGLIVGVYGWIYRLNQRAVEVKLIPLRDRFSDLLNAFSDSDD